MIKISTKKLREIQSSENKEIVIDFIKNNPEVLQSNHYLFRNLKDKWVELGYIDAEDNIVSE